MNKIKTLNVFKNMAAAILPGHHREPSIEDSGDHLSDTDQADQPGKPATVSADAGQAPAKETVTTLPERRYQVMTVEKTSSPDGSSDSDWYRYVIEVPGSTLTGTRCGTRQEVTRFASDYVENLSSRNGPYARQATGVARKKK